VRDNADPLAAPSKPPSDPELAALREQKILPVLAELRNSDPQARATAANAIFGLLGDDKCRRLLLREQLLRLLLKESLADSNPEVRATGWDIIKSVAEKEDSGFCIHLYRQEILPAIEFAVGTVSYFFSLQIPALPRFFLFQLTAMRRLTNSNPGSVAIRNSRIHRGSLRADNQSPASHSMEGCDLHLLPSRRPRRSSR